MRINAPSMKLDMLLCGVEIREQRPIITCRIGSYNATTELSREDMRNFVRSLLRPKVAWAFAKVFFGKSE